ncbi:MAG TPA: hypothetical protein VFD50_11445 [Thermoleophilia bacterium]|nr:hypothetical protein [Thermoleophilia bacterium]
MDRRRLALTGVTLGLVVLAVAPAVVAFWAGWLHLPHIEPPGHPAAPDRTAPEAWAAFAVFYLFWIVGVCILLVWCYDRLGYHWQPHERKPRLSRKERRKRAAVMGALTMDDDVRVEAALRRRNERDRRRSAEAEASAKARAQGMPPAGPSGHGAGRPPSRAAGAGRSPGSTGKGGG